MLDAIKNYFDSSLFDELGDSFDLLTRVIQKAFNYDALDNVLEFQAIVLTPPIPVSFNNKQLQNFVQVISSAETEEVDNLPKFAFKARIIGPLSPHLFWPDPCDPKFLDDVGTQEHAIDWILKHTDVLSIGADTVPNTGDVVTIKLNTNIYTVNPEKAVLVNIVQKSVAATPTFSAECQGSIQGAFGNYAGGLGGYGAPKPPVPLDKKRLPEINRIVKVLYDRGITSKYAIGGILSVIGKEVGGTYVPKGENSYAGTPPARIREVWSATSGPDTPGKSKCPVKILGKDIPVGTFIANLSDAQIKALTKDEKRFWEFVYGGRFKNKCGDDAYKYRGGGLNQITFRAGYERVDKLLGTDYTTNPKNLSTGSDAIEKSAAASWAFFTGFHKAQGHPNSNSEWNAVTSYEAASIAAADKNGGVNPHPRSRANSQRYLQGIIDAIEAGEIKIPPTP